VVVVVAGTATLLPPFVFLFSCSVELPVLFLSPSPVLFFFPALLAFFFAFLSSAAFLASSSASNS
jgi:hypothetical protein